MLSAALLITLLTSQAPALGEDYMVLYTDHGGIVLGLYPKVAPKHVAQLLKLARAGIYDGNHFHRIQKGFVAQVASAEHRQPKLTSEQAALVAPIPDEFSELKHERFTLSMAKWPKPNSAKSSFSIVLGRAPHLDKKFTVFGRVVRGQQTVAKIEKLPVKGTAPIERLSVRRMVVVHGRAAADAIDLSKAPSAAPPSQGSSKGSITMIAPIVAGALGLLALIGFALRKRSAA